MIGRWPGFKWFKRLGYTLFYLSADQFYQRLKTRMNFRLERLQKTGDPPEWATVLPDPVFPPRSALCVISNEGTQTLRLPWIDLKLDDPPVWQPRTGVEPTQAEAELNQLHYMEFLEALPADQAARAILRWIDHHPRRAAGAWRLSWRPYNLSLRVVAWLQALALHRQDWDVSTLETIQQSLAEQTDYLARHLETDVRSNHLIKNVKALLWAGRAFAGPKAQTWHSLGLRHLEAELDKQILADGCHYERSPTYHCQVLGDLLECLPLLEPSQMRTQLERRVRTMVDILPCLTHPDGKVALFNDGGLHMARELAELAVAAGRLLEVAPTEKTGGFGLADAGYFGWRGPDELLLIDHGEIGPPYPSCHGHGDILAFEWSIKGERVIVDQGTFQYKAGARRIASRSASSHNTIVIKGHEPNDFFSAFRCGRRAHPTKRDWQVKEQGIELTAQHDGYRHLPGKPVPERMIEAGPGWLRFCDRVIGNARHDAVTHLLLHPKIGIERRDLHHLILSGSEVRLELLSNREITIEPTLWFPDLYCAIETNRLVMALPRDAPLEVSLAQC